LIFNLFIILIGIAMIYNGKHVMIDAVVLNNGEKLLNDANLGKKLLENIIEEIDMTMILPVVTVQFPHSICEMKRVLESLQREELADSNTAKRIEKDLLYRQMQTYGYSSFAMIAESHLSIHTFPEESFFTFDCYSCKDFDDTKIKNLMLEFFGQCNMNYQSIPRMIPGK
jgi:S-adenosylmethionine decarboxylase